MVASPPFFMQKHFPDLGFGLGLRPSHYSYIVEHKPAVSWFEIISENFMDTDGRPKRNLARVREHYPIVMHGVSLSIGTIDPLNSEYLEKLKALAQWLKPAWISDHVCWTGVAHKNTHDLLPIPYTEEALKHVVQRIKAVQDFLEMPIALENPSTYLEFKSSHMPEAEFIARMADESGCHLLLDVNNVYVTCFNHRLDAQAYLDALPLDRVIQIHLSGHTNKGTHIVDTHDAPVIDAVLTLYHYVLEKAGRVPNTMIEWDDHIPEFPELFSELEKVKQVAVPTGAPGVLPQLAGGRDHHISNQPVPLAAAQQRMQDSILAGSRSTDRPEDWIRAKDNFSPAAQLEVYSHAYRWRLFDVVADDYPVLKNYLGDQAFKQLITDFVEETPSTHFNVGRYATQLPDYLAGHTVYNSFAHALCRLESAISLVAEMCETQALAPEHVQGLTPETLMATRFYPRTALRLFAFDFPVNDYYIAVREEKALPAITPQKSWLAIFRHDDVVWRMTLEETEFQLLQALFSGKAVGGALEEMAAQNHDVNQLAAQLSHYFARWMRNGLLAAHEYKNSTQKKDAA